jgi:hypothetical protein
MDENPYEPPAPIRPSASGSLRVSRAYVALLVCVLLLSAGVGIAGLINGKLGQAASGVVLSVLMGVGLCEANKKSGSLRRPPPATRPPLFCPSRSAR